MANRIYTVGHSTRDFDEILTMLENYEITHLVDVRSFPSPSGVSAAAQHGRAVITSRTFIPVAVSLEDVTQVTRADVTARWRGQEFANDFHSSSLRSMSAARSAAALPSSTAASSGSARR
jgi:hypothetical protein